MSLRARLLLSIALILLGVLMLGGTLLGWRATRSVEVEMRAAAAGAGDAAQEALARRGERPDPAFLSTLVSSFNGQRHVRAMLPGHAPSRLAATPDIPPAWFDALIRVPPETVRIPVNDSGGVLVLTTDPTNEIAEVWKQAEDSFVIMLLFCGASLVAVYAIIGRALGFFSTFDGALRGIADGGYRSRMPEKGPPEFASLARGFNRMAARLDGYERKNRALQEQVLTLQEEERAEIARDLHDEVGPHLFAIGVDAEAAGLPSIRESVAHVQKHIRAILRQLRPAGLLDFGFRTALDDLVAFWSRRDPSMRFDLDIAVEDAELDARTAEVVYRIVQESVSNAVRHGHPTAIAIAVSRSAAAVCVRVSDNGAGLGSTPSGMGLAGMTERVRALDGSLTVEAGPSGHGVCVTAVLPRREEVLA
jgi:two-component system sensor histidine kinase UhpB